MKCKTCKKRMQPVTTKFSIVCNNRTLEVINVPAEQCPVCGAVQIFDLVRENAKRYASASQCLIVDYSKYEDEENTNLIITQMLLW